MCICRMGSTDMSEPKNKTLASPCGDYNLQLENKIRRLENEIENMKLNNAVDKDLKWYM